MVDSLIGGYQILANLGRPLSSDDSRVAYYDVPADRIVLVGLRDGKARPLRAGMRFGCWFDSRRFVAATDKEMRLVTEDAEPRLLGGPWLPLGADPKTGRVVLCGPGSHPGVFDLIRLKVVLAK